jgi:hypothetical protein
MVNQRVVVVERRAKVNHVNVHMIPRIIIMNMEHSWLGLPIQMVKLVMMNSVK